MFEIIRMYTTVYTNNMVDTYTHLTSYHFRPPYMYALQHYAMMTNAKNVRRLQKPQAWDHNSGTWLRRQADSVAHAMPNIRAAAQFTRNTSRALQLKSARQTDWQDLKQAAVYETSEIPPVLMHGIYTNVQHALSRLDLYVE